MNLRRYWTASALLDKATCFMDRFQIFRTQSGACWWLWHRQAIPQRRPLHYLTPCITPGLTHCCYPRYVSCVFRVTRKSCSQLFLSASPLSSSSPLLLCAANTTPAPSSSKTNYRLFHHRHLCFIHRNSRSLASNSPSIKETNWSFAVTVAKHKWKIINKNLSVDLTTKKLCY